MNKEQLLGRLLMHGHINMDEFYLLSSVKAPNLEQVKQQEPNPYTATQKKEQETKGMFDWLDEFRRDRYIALTTPYITKH